MEEILARLDRVDTALADIRAAVSVNAELVHRNVALSIGTSGGGGGGGASGSDPFHFPRPYATGNGNGNAGVERTVSVRLSDDTVALIANPHTFEMKDELKRAGARWASDTPVRWNLPRAAWDENSAAWSSSFHVTFVIAA
jgi:hypothetical protein